MDKVKIITDSCSDLSSELLFKYSIDYAKMSTVLDGKEKSASLTWDSKEAHELYETIRNGQRITTTQVSVAEFTSVFEKYLKTEHDIVYIGCSSKQSGSVNTGRLVAKKLEAEYPSSKIICIDSLNASLGEGMLAIEAAKMAAEGKNAAEIEKNILSIRKNVNQFATVHTLEYLKKAGRVSAASAFFGNIIGVKPILISDKNGTQVAYKKVKGRSASISEIVSLLKENIIDSQNQTIYVGHADCTKEEIDEVCSLIKSQIPCSNIFVGYIGPIIGASVGPDTIGVWAFGKEVSFSVGEK